MRVSERFQLVTPPSFALSVFRLRPRRADAPLAAANALNRRFWDRLLERHEVLLTQTELGGVFCVRFAVGAARTEEGDVEKAWEVVDEVGRAVVSEETERH